MANRILRFILDNDTEGSLQVDDPLKYKEMDLVLTRDNKFFAISSELLEVQLGFFGEARDYLLNILSTQSFDNEVRIDLDLSIDKGQTYEDSFEGIADWETFNEDFVGDDGHIVSMVFVRSGFFARFMNHQETEIDVAQVKDLYGNTRETINVNSLELHSQTTSLQYISDANQDVINEAGADTTLTWYGIPLFDNTTVDELEEITDQAFNQIILNAQPVGINYTIRDTENGFNRVFTIVGNATLDIGVGGGQIITQVDLQWFVQKNALAEQSIGSVSTSNPGTTSATVNILIPTPVSRTIGNSATGNEFRVYLKIIIATVAPDNKDLDLTFIDAGTVTNFKISNDIDFDPFFIDSMLIHELGNRITNSITGVNSRFFSEYLGNRASQIQSYSDDGCGSFFAVASGNMLRDKSIADSFWNISFKDYFEGIDGILNLGLIVEDSGGSDRVRMEPKHFFFQSGSPVLQLLNVDYKRTLATEFIFKKVDTGFSEWKSEDFNSIDDWSTNQVRTSRYATIGVDKDIRSNFIAASYAIETTRRKKIDTKSWRLDNDNFIIALNRSTGGSPEAPDELDTAEKNENFITVNNIAFPAVAYNLRLSPTRNFLRWGNVINAGLVDYAADLWRWQGGEGNQDFESRIRGSCEGSFNNDILEENNDIQWDYSASPATDEQTPLFKPVWYTFTVALSLDDYKTLRDNKTNSFEIVSRDGTIIELFLWELRYNLFRGQGQFKAIEANV